LNQSHYFIYRPRTCWPPRYEVTNYWTHGISSMYWVTLLLTTYLSLWWLWQF